MKKKSYATIIKKDQKKKERRKKYEKNKNLEKNKKGSKRNIEKDYKRFLKQNKKLQNELAESMNDFSKKSLEEQIRILEDIDKKLIDEGKINSELYIKNKMSLESIKVYKSFQEKDLIYDDFVREDITEYLTEDNEINEDKLKELYTDFRSFLEKDPDNSYPPPDSIFFKVKEDKEGIVKTGEKPYNNRKFLAKFLKASLKLLILDKYLYSFLVSKLIIELAKSTDPFINDFIIECEKM